MRETTGCDGEGPHSGGERRVLPCDSDNNAILCRRCYERELAFRRMRNRETPGLFETPSWESLRVYEEV